MRTLAAPPVETRSDTTEALLAGAAALEAASRTLLDASETQVDLRLAVHAAEVARQAARHADRLRELAAARPG